MKDALKARDLQRDPRYALHSASEDPDDWTGDAKVAGVAEEVTSSDGKSHRFRLDILEASTVGLDDERKHLVITVWTPARRRPHHEALAGVAQARCYPVDRQEQRAGQVGVGLPAGGLVRAPSLRQGDLEVVQRREVVVPYAQRALEHGVGVEQLRLASEPEQLLHRELVLRADVVERLAAGSAGTSRST